jgi:hypothetical protein
MSIDIAMSMLASEIKRLETEAAIAGIIRGQAKNQNGRLTEFGKKLIKICLEDRMPQSVVAKLLDISSAAVNQHAAKDGVRVMDIKTKCAMIRWDSDETDIDVNFQSPREGIPDYSGKAKIGQFEGDTYIMITANQMLASICGRVMGEICDRQLITGITTRVSVAGASPVDGFVESVNMAFGRNDPNSFPIVLICLKKLLV